MESLLREWDGETVIVRYDRPTGAWVFIAIHSTRLGPGAGGTRMKPYSDVQAALQDAFRLAAGMSYKFATAGIPFGGAKAVIAIPPDVDPQSRAALLRRYGAVVHQLNGLFSTGPDVGTSAADMDIIAETGAPYVFGRTSAAGGGGSTGPFTALGVFTGIQVACEHLFGEASLRGRRVLVQGAGSVGGTLIEHLRAADAEVMFSEVDKNAIRSFRDELGLKFVSSEAAYTTECDIFAPCALGGLFNANTIPRLKCRVVAGGANNQLASPKDAESLRDRGILYAPDYVINVGGAMAILGLETQGWTQDRAEKEVVEGVRQALRHVFELAATQGITTDAAAHQIAEKRLSAAK
ncbi:MAG: Glu/Leu/Phe/Val dehydrogenase [Deltaproteobacteria bacterium]|nr:Glu/Leu/Phe/Val dehydrogenase [Deltaproteobacteria bacterium]